MGSKPKYREVGDPELDANPLTAHLPSAPENENEASQALFLPLEFDPAERNARTSFRMRQVKRLKHLYVPADPEHSRFLRELLNAVHISYVHRNPFSTVGQQRLHGRVRSESEEYRASIYLLTGDSGMGKSRLVDRLTASLGSQVVQHTSFRRRSFPETQVVWLRRNVPDNCTVSRLCRTFGAEVDRVLKRVFYGPSFNRLPEERGDQDVYFEEIRALATSLHVGLIVIDEFQELMDLGAQGRRILHLLVNLRDELRVPILVVGTKKSLKLLESNLAPARRVGEGGTFQLLRPLSAHDPVFRITAERAWRYQWVKNPVPFDDSIAEVLYKRSQGITGIMIDLIVQAQLIGLQVNQDDPCHETVTAATIERAYQTMVPIHGAMNALSSGDPKLMDHYEDLAPKAWAEPEEDGKKLDLATEVPDGVSPADWIEVEKEPTLVQSGPKKSRPNTLKAEPIIKLSAEQMRLQVFGSDTMRSLIEVLR